MLHSGVSQLAMSKITFRTEALISLKDHVQNQSLDLIVLHRAFQGAVELLTTLGSIAASKALEDHIQIRSLDYVVVCGMFNGTVELPLHLGLSQHAMPSKITFRTEALISLKDHVQNWSLDHVTLCGKVH